MITKLFDSLFSITCKLLVLAMAVAWLADKALDISLF